MNSVGLAAPLGAQESSSLFGLRTVLGKHHQFPWGAVKPDLNSVFVHPK